MYTKCFVVLNTDQNTEIVSEFVNPSSREFLMHELKNILAGIDKRAKSTLSEVPTSNGIWYYKSNNSI